LTADCDVFGRGLVALGRAMATAGRGLATSGRSLATLYLVVGEGLLRVGRCSGCLFLFGMLVGPVGWLSSLPAPRFGLGFHFPCSSFRPRVGRRFSGR
jgi:hypothetical protein